MQPTREENDALRALVEQELLNKKTTLTDPGRWVEWKGGVFVTGYKDASAPLTSENVWCCMSNGEYEGRQSVWTNLQASILACESVDPRRTDELPQTYEISVLATRDKWVRVTKLEELKCGKHLTLAVKQGKQMAIYLPSVWSEEAKWTPQDLLMNLAEKAGIRSLDELEVYEINTYSILPLIAYDVSFFPPVSACAKEEGTCRDPIVSGVRPATHAGSWYPKDDLKELVEELLTSCAPEHNTQLIIAPHAGYEFTGAVIGCAYDALKTKGIKRVFVLGPSHFYYTPCCEVSRYASYNTPVGMLKCDVEVLEQLQMTNGFKTMEAEVELKEHSLEMQMPFIAQLLPEATIVPILVGDLSLASQKYYGTLLAGYVADPETAFVVSSDFCHYGPDYHYTPFPPKVASQAIKAMDMKGIAALANPTAWDQYLKTTKNTICGRDAIGILLYALEYNHAQYRVKLLKYGTSGPITTAQDNAVSYAAVAFT